MIVPAPLVPAAGEGADGSRQGSHVHVVAACVHHRDPAAVRRIGDRGARVVEAGPLLNRQGVHVGPEHDPRAVPVRQNRDDARLADAGRHVRAGRRELPGDQRAGPHLTSGQLGVLMQVVVEGDQVGQVRRVAEDPPGPLRDLCGQARSVTAHGRALPRTGFA